MDDDAIKKMTPEGPDQKKLFALLVDGYARDLFTTGMVLQRLGYETYIASSAEDALKIIEAAMPVLVITEISLSQMSGLELLVRIKHDPHMKSIPVIIYTADANPKYEQLCRASGCANFLKKPVDPGSLYGAIQQATETTPRANIRLKTLLPVRIGGTAGDKSTECISGLSENGVFIRTLSPRSAGTVLSITIIVRSIPIKVKAVVLRSITISPGLFKEPGMAMRFLEIAATDRELIRNFIRGQIMKDIPIQSQS